jgi:3-oxoacyl-(acyl-carrier-protein) synthase
MVDGLDSRPLDNNSLSDSAFYALVAAREALDDSGLCVDKSKSIGLALGTASGHGEELFNERCRTDKIFTPARFLSAVVAKTLKLMGPVVTLPVACAAGCVAVIDGILQLAHGRADAMLVGGTEGLSSVSFSGFASLNVLTPDVTRPFDLNRTGFLIGEGAGIIVLERLTDARARNAPVYAEVVGFGLSADAYHVIQPDPLAGGLIHSIKCALRTAKCSPDDIDYTNAHGTATQANDRAECEALTEIFHSSSRPIVANSFKAILGHTMGAAGAIETIGCVLSIYNQVIPPTWNFETKDPNCGVDCVPNEPRKTLLKRVLKNSSGFGGSNGSLVLGRI